MTEVPDSALGPQIEQARAAQRGGDWAQAQALWAALAARAPDHPAVQAGLGLSLTMLGRHDAADEVLAPALARWPDHPPVAIESARVAQRRPDWAEALRRWSHVRARFPRAVEGAQGVAVSLLNLGRLAEMEEGLAGAVGDFPAAASLAVAYARAAQRRGDWPEALRRWFAVTDHFPANADGVAGTGTALQMLERFEEAEALLAHGVVHFPRHLGIALAHARVKVRQQDWTAAMLRWQQMMESFPDSEEACLGAVMAAMKLDRWSDAEIILAQAVSRFPTNSRFVNQYAMLAERQHDLTEARSRWQLAAERFPGDANIQASLARVGFEQRFQSTDAVSKVEHEPAATDGLLSPEAAARRDLMMRFEALGSGCEFGLVQRHFGAEPISLLRWGAIPVQGLLRALEARFDGLGDPEHVSLFEFGDSGEYFFRDSLYALGGHTFIRVQGSDYQRVFAQQCRRARYLAAKLMEALETPAEELARIFVYKRHTESLNEDEIVALHRAVRRYGRHHLLCVCEADAAHADRSVEVRGDGLLVGYIAGLSPVSNAREIRYESWLALCQQAADLCRFDAEPAVTVPAMPPSLKKPGFFRALFGYKRR